MTREQPEALMQSLLALGDAMGATSAVLDDFGDTEERRELRRPLGGMMADLYIELMRPIIEQYPELDPDQVGGSCFPVSNNS